MNLVPAPSGEPATSQQVPPLLSPANGLIDRQSEANILVRLLITEEHRLVSLTGMGSMGKTRLACG